MWRIIFGLLVVAACNDSSPGLLSLDADSHQITPGGTTFVRAYFVDPSTGPTDNMAPVSATWSSSPDGIVTLTNNDNTQTVTGVAVGEVVVTASSDGQTAQVGFSVLAQ
jgi:uncharacterized protein YjdB